MMRIWARSIALLMAFLMLLGTLAGCAGVLDPLGYLKNSVKRTWKESLAGRALGVLFDAVGDGSVALDFGGSDLVQNLPDEAHVKMWFDAKNKRLCADASLTLSGEAFEGSAFLTNGELVVVSSTFFGSNTLGVDFATLENDLKTSVFSNNSGTAFSVPSLSSASASRICTLKNGTFELLGGTDDAAKAAEKTLDLFLDALGTYATHTRYKASGLVYVTLDINNNSLSRALRATHEMAGDDKALVKYLKQTAETLDALRSAASGVNDKALSDRLEYFLNSEADMDEICLAVDQAEPFSFVLEVGIRSFGMRVESAQATFVQSGVTRAALSLQMPRKGNERSVSLSLDGVLYELVYQILEDGYRSYCVDIRYQETTSGGEAMSITGTLQADKREKSYVLTLSGGAQTYALSGSYLFEKDEVMLSIDGATVNGAGKKLSLTVRVKSGERAPAVPDYINVVRMDVPRFSPIFERATAAAARLESACERVGGIPYRFYGRISGKSA